MEFLVDKMLEDKLQDMGLTGIILIAQAGTLEEWLSDDVSPFPYRHRHTLNGKNTIFKNI